MTPDLSVCGVRQGQPCWLVPTGEPGVPERVESAVLVTHGGEAFVLAGGRLWDCRQVFTDEAAARAKAISDARWWASYHREQLELARKALVALGDAPGEEPA